MSKKNARKPEFVIVWEFHIKAGKRREFETVYGSGGDWVCFFRHGKEYIRTELIRDVKTPRRYLTLDFWTTRQAYLQFKKENHAEYQAIDDKCMSLTEDEALVGEFQSQWCGTAAPGCPGELARRVSQVRFQPVSTPLVEVIAECRPEKTSGGALRGHPGAAASHFFRSRLYGPRHCHSRQRRPQTQNIIREEICEQQCPLPLLEISHRLKCEAGECGEGAAKSHYDQQAPARIEQDTFRGPNHEEADNEAAADVYEKCSVRKNRAEKFCGIAADDPARVSPYDCANGYDQEVVHDGVSLTAVVVGVISPRKRTVMANSIANTFLPQRVRTSQAQARYRRARPGDSCF